MICDLAVLVNLDDLATQYLPLRDCHFLLAGLAREGALEKLARAGAGDGDKLKTVLFWRSFQRSLPFQT